MKIIVSNPFIKDTKALPVHVHKAIAKTVEELEAAKNLFDISNCAKLQGTKDMYRIRLGSYRMTLTLLITKDTVILLRILPRGQVYKKL
jgi:mRNA interferase RelE/StbE